MDRHVRAEIGTIELRLRELSQLFDALDPSPFLERDLHPNTEEYIVDSIKEMPKAAASALVIHLDQPSAIPDEEVAIGNVIRTHFARRSRLLQRDLRRLIERGLISVVIGLSFLAVVFVIAQLVAPMDDHPAGALLEEGLLIVGWVALWRPLEIFLYDWWPILGDQRIHERLSRAPVRIVSGSVSSPQSA
jgi:hypothetical protein